MFERIYIYSVGWVGNVSIVPSSIQHVSALSQEHLATFSVRDILTARRGELFPLLVRALHEKEIVAMQFLRGGSRTGQRAL